MRQRRRRSTPRRAQLNIAVASANLSNTSAQSQVNSAQSLLVAALAQRETAEHNLANATLTAPHDGVITVINGTAGGTPGVPVNGSTSSVAPPGSTFIQIVDVSVLQVQANVGESDAASVRIGVTRTVYGECLWPAEVWRNGECYLTQWGDGLERSDVPCDRGR